MKLIKRVFFAGLVLVLVAAGGFIASNRGYTSADKLTAVFNEQVAPKLPTQVASLLSSTENQEAASEDSAQASEENNQETQSTQQENNTQNEEEESSEDTSDESEATQDQTASDSSEVVSETEDTQTEPEESKSLAIGGFSLDTGSIQKLLTSLPLPFNKESIQDPSAESNQSQEASDSPQEETKEVAPADQIEQVAERGKIVSEQIGQVLGDFVQVNEQAEGNKALHDKAFEYGQYLYCQQVVEVYERDYNVN